MLEGLLLMLLSVSGCVAQDREALLWGQPGQGSVTIGPVPAQKMWLIRAAGGFTNRSDWAEYMMEVVRPVRQQGNACCWRVPVARSAPGYVGGTPTIALERPLVLHEGESLSVRTSPSPQGQIGVTAVYYELERGCLPLS